MCSKIATTYNNLNLINCLLTKRIGFSAGLKGRICIERGLCEAAQRLKPGGSLGEEILRVVFL
jgi:ABC-type Na+ transport system ATPase subunit NatA